MMLALKFLIIFLLINQITSDLIDLSYDFSNNTIYWGEIQPFIFTKILENYGNYWYAMKEFCAGEHGGTHLDAPYHFYQNGWKINEIPLSRLFVKGNTLDLSEKVLENGPDTLLTVNDLMEWQTINGPFDNPAVLMIRFGWSRFYGNKSMYWNPDYDGRLHFPGVSKEAADWIVKSRKFYGVGIDTSSIDPGLSTTYSSHRILNEHQLYILENVNLTTILPIKNYTLVILPMKIKDGTGAPTRIIAQIGGK